MSALDLKQAEALEDEIERAVGHLRRVATVAAQNVQERADAGRVRRDTLEVRQCDVEGALQDAQEVLGRLLPHLPK